MSKRQRWTLGVVALATFMMLLDVTVVTVALPSVYRDFHTNLSDLQWIVDAYLLMMAALILPAGSIGDKFGHRKVWMAGIVLFMLASAGCGLSVNIVMLDLMRAAQGIGAVLLLATALPLIAQAFPPEKRIIAFGVFGAAMGSALATGPLVGGMLTQWLSWRWIFLINIPLGICALIGCVLNVVESRDDDARPVDWPSVVTLVGSLFLLAFALVRGNQDGWASGRIIGAEIIGGILLVAFLARQFTAKNPMVPMSLFRDRGFLATTVVSFLLGVSLLGIFAYLAIYLQGTLGYGPLATGVRFLPVTLVAVVFSPPSAKLSERVPSKFLLGVAMLLVGVGVTMMATLDDNAGWTSLLPGFVVAGIGLGATAPLLADVILKASDDKQVGLTAGIVLGARQLGNSVGVAVFGALYEARISGKLTSSLHGTPLQDPGIVRTLTNVVSAGGEHQAVAAVPAPLRETFRHAADQASTSGLRYVLVLAAVTAFLGAIGALMITDPEHAVPEPAGPDLAVVDQTHTDEAVGTLAQQS